MAIALVCCCGSAAAELKELVIAQQPGIGYLNQHAQAAGLGDVKVTWQAIFRGSAMTEALNTMPLYLNAKNPSIKSLADFTDKDRIALPAVKTSIQTATLQMAAAQGFGDANRGKLDALTVTMSHPDATRKMLDAANTEISAHFNAPPFQYQQLENPAIKTVTSSYDVLTGVSAFNVLWASGKVAKENPTLLAAFIEALDEATTSIRADRDGAAALYIRVSKEKASPKEITDFLSNPYIEHTLTPTNVWRYSNFMARTGVIKVRPTSWRDLLFPNIHERSGS